jgi:hypothetical protein
MCAVATHSYPKRCLCSRQSAARVPNWAVQAEQFGDGDLGRSDGIFDGEDHSIGQLAELT